MKKIDMMKVNINTIGTLISILLLLIGNVSAEDNASDITVEDPVNNSSVGTESIVVITGEDINGSAIEDTVFEDVQETQTEKKSSPGFESMMIVIAFLSVIIVIRR